LKTIGFVLPILGVSGGVHIVLRWAHILTRRGHMVYVLVPHWDKTSRVPFLAPEMVNFPILTYEEGKAISYDLLFGTWWETLHRLPEYEAREHAFLAQALESQFYPPGTVEQHDYTRLVCSGLPIITIAHWVSACFVDVLGIPRDRVKTVLNPLDKSLWRPVEPMIPRDQHVRFLIEGPSIDERKNVAPSIRLLEEAGAPYIWVGAVVDRALVGPNCVAVLESVPYDQMPSVYASADVLLKLSNAEGMFGPPLEMFASGGTAVVWDVPGCEEYMTHLYNAWLAPMNSFPDAADGIRALIRSPELLARLKQNAVETARRWPDWSEGESHIIAAVESLPSSQHSRFFREVARTLSRRLHHAT
jgi:glycosyltransferase involved in cell wall biosynthesis